MVILSDDPDKPIHGIAWIARLPLKAAFQLPIFSEQTFHNFLYSIHFSSTCRVNIIHKNIKKT